MVLKTEGAFLLKTDSEIGEILAKARNLCRFSNQPVAEIVQCGEPAP